MLRRPNLPKTVATLLCLTFALLTIAAAPSYAAITVPVGGSPVAVAHGDFNRDGRPDLVTVTTTNSKIAVALNSGSGVFAPASGYTLSPPNGGSLTPIVAVADINGDGNQDIIGATSGFMSGNLAVLYGDGTGVFPTVAYFPTVNIVKILIGDYNGDLLPDVGQLYAGGGITCPFSGFTVHLNNGSGGLVGGGTISAGARGLDFAQADLNHDGNLDVIVTGLGSICSQWGLMVIWGDGDGTFTSGPTYAGVYPSYLAVGDFNEDSHPDFVSTPINNSILLYPGNEFGNFVTGASHNFGGTNTAIRPLVADFNNDGNADIAVINQSGNAVSLIYGNGTSSSFLSLTSRPTGTSPIGLIAADFNGDGQLDLASANQGSNDVTIQTDVGAPAQPQPALYDFDGDNRTDIAVYRPGASPGAPSNWYVLRSSDFTFFGVQFGVHGDVPVPGDYDGDGLTNFGVYRPSTGYWYTSLDPATNYGAFLWGLDGDIPTPGDFDNDGKTDRVVFRPSNAYWYVHRSAANGSQLQKWGTGTDRPLVGDFDGDGRNDYAFYRPGAGTQSTSYWSIIRSTDSQQFIQPFGLGQDIPAPADYDGDCETNIAVFRPATGYWYTSLNPGINYGAVLWGTNGDRPAPGDYDGDGKADVAVFRPALGDWWVLRSSNGTFFGQHWGQNGDIAVPSAFIP